MNLNHLYYFRALAKEEHYTRTVDMLSITQPSLSHAISCLEGELGVKLFEKQGRNAKLTKYGALFLRYVEQSLDMLDEGKRVLTETSGISGGFIDMGYIFTLGSHFIPNLIKSYLEEKGENHIRFSFGQGTTKKIVEELKDGKYDLAFSSYIEGEDELEFIPVGQEDLVLIMPKDHPLTEKKEIDLMDTVDYDYVYFTSNGIFGTIAIPNPAATRPATEESSSPSYAIVGCLLIFEKQLSITGLNPLFLVKYT